MDKKDDTIGPDDPEEIKEDHHIKSGPEVSMNERRPEVGPDRVDFNTAPTKPRELKTNGAKDPTAPFIGLHNSYNVSERFPNQSLPKIGEQVVALHQREVDAQKAIKQAAKDYRAETVREVIRGRKIGLPNLVHDEGQIHKEAFEQLLEEGKGPSVDPKLNKSPVSITEERTKRVGAVGWLGRIAAGLGIVAVVGGAVENTAQADAGSKTAESSRVKTGPGVYSETNPKITKDSTGKLMVDTSPGTSAAQGSIRAEYLSNPETLTTDFRVDNFDVDPTTGRVAVMATLGDGKKYLLVGNMGANGSIQLENTGLLSGYPFEIDISNTNPNNIAVALDSSLVISSNAGKDKEIVQTGVGFVYDLQYSPDNKFIYYTAADPNNSNRPALYRYEISTKQNTQVGVPAGFGVSYLNRLQTLSQPNTYKTFSTDDGSRGYWVDTIDAASNSLSSVRVSPGEAYPVTDLTVFPWQGKDRVEVIDSTTKGKGSNDPNLYFATAYDFIDNLKVHEIQANEALYAPLPADCFGVFIGSLVVDPATNTGYMVTAVNINNIIYPHLETFALDDPENMSKRQRMSENGAWPTIGFHGGSNLRSSLMNVAGKKYLVLDLASDTLQGSGMYFRDITNGPSGGEWVKMTEYTQEQATPTPTASPSPTPTQRPPESTPTPQPSVISRIFLPVVQRAWQYIGGW